ncbi:MAG: hypothetical protein [Chaetfec virus UA24_144]|nr:MAG: hypothetical protein [Chaetfec virus UA24_144]
MLGSFEKNELGTDSSFDSQKLEYIRKELGPHARYECIAEEASEVAHAALKCMRILEGKNPTSDDDFDKAYKHLADELGDLSLAVDIWGGWPSKEKYTEARDRLLQRLQQRGTQEERHYQLAEPVSYRDIQPDGLNEEQRRMYEHAMDAELYSRSSLKVPDPKEHDIWRDAR